MGDAPDRKKEEEKNLSLIVVGWVARNYICHARKCRFYSWLARERSVHPHPSLWYMSQACRNCLELTTSYLPGYHRYGRNLELEQLYLFRDLFLHAVSTSTS